MQVYCAALPLMKAECQKGKLLFRLHFTAANTVCTATGRFIAKHCTLCKAGVHCLRVVLSCWEGYATPECRCLGGSEEYDMVSWWEDYNMVGVQLWEESADLTTWEHALCDDLTQASLLFLTSWSSSFILWCL